MSSTPARAKGPFRPARPSPVKKLAQPAPSFPPAWAWFADELVPSYVKKHYSPREGWKDKPFSKEDVRFFSKGVIELSEIFTGERGGKVPAYFLHPKFRSAYLLYFLPLQMAKFVTIFQLHSKAIDAALEHASENGVLRVADLGAGPGTASTGLLLHLLSLKKELPKIELVWFDTNKTILEDGKNLAEALASQFPKLRGKVSVEFHVAPWWVAADELRESCSLILMGHVLNEAHDLPSGGKVAKQRAFAKSPRAGEDEEEDQESRGRRGHPLHPVWEKLIRLAHGGGLLAVEPASKGTSQFLSRLRDQLFEDEIIAAKATSLWGPCLHAERCPLAQGRDWCHFSVPTQVPGKWFREISRALSSERLWLKFSYLWLASGESPSPLPDKNVRRVISDPLGRDGQVLVCEPERPGKVGSSEREPLWRGDLIRIRS